MRKYLTALTSVKENILGQAILSGDMDMADGFDESNKKIAFDVVIVKRV